ncbi:MAG: aminotransferase class V-fold PLP-dependent enzyme, partial [Thermoanaerobaculia bacterium]|nr:aminotransferase class V-fold PLP-dependent enzyme [Thermoanaerobaculia bacterium]
EAKLTARLIEGIESNPKLRVLGRGAQEIEERSAVVSIVSDGPRPAELASRLAERQIAVGAGHFYAVRLLQALGIDPERGVLRASLVHYNTEEEVDRLLDALE